MTQAAALLELCRAQGILLATAESCTGGMVGAALTQTPGSSDVYERGFITYSNDAKRDMLGVQGETLAQAGAVSEDVAREMAQGALNHSRASLAVAVTGIAGPGGSQHKPEGRVCFAVATPQRVTSETVEFGAIGRQAVRQGATNHALALLKGAVTG